MSKPGPYLHLLKCRNRHGRRIKHLCLFPFHALRRCLCCNRGAAWTWMGHGWKQQLPTSVSSLSLLRTERCGVLFSAPPRVKEKRPVFAWLPRRSWESCCWPACRRGCAKSHCWAISERLGGWPYITHALVHVKSASQDGENGLVNLCLQCTVWWYDVMQCFGIGCQHRHIGVHPCEAQLSFGNRLDTFKNRRLVQLLSCRSLQFSAGDWICSPPSYTNWNVFKKKITELFPLSCISHNTWKWKKRLFTAPASVQSRAPQ